MIEQAVGKIKENLETKNPILDLSECKITGYEKELDLLQECKHLKALDLSFNDDTMRNTDFSLRKLICLEKLNLESAYQPDLNFDLSFLKDLKELKYLNVSDNNMYDFQFSELPHLEELYLWGNDFQNITFLKNNKSLKVLNLTMNWISDISVLSDFLELEILHLAENSIQDISSLSKLKNLKKLYLRENSIQDISALETSESLEYLDIQENPIQHKDKQVKALKTIENLLF